ncbi:60S ribosomal protein L6 [Aphelenchoides besseyi]|nr:60S ribosomal protein L6 [Aphelenchoides besseyi]
MTPSAKGVKKTPRMPRNSELAPGLSRFSAGRIFHKRGLWKKLEKPRPAAEKKAAPEKFTVKKVGGAKNGGERKVLLTKTFKYKSQVRKPTKSAHRKPKGQPLRKSITPGTVLIVLAGRHRGKRVVFLKQLDSGLLLISGPLRYNSTPLRRIAQAFVIATKTRVKISGIELPKHLNDEYFKRTDDKKDKRKAEGDIFAEKKSEFTAQYTVSDQRKEDQKKVDAMLINCIKSHPESKFLRAYLSTKFALGKGDLPHKLVF